MITCHCPHCQAFYELDASVADHKVRCAECSGAFIAPADGSVNVVGTPVAEEAKKPATTQSHVPQRKPPLRQTMPAVKPKRSMGGKLVIASVVVLAAAGGGFFLMKELNAGTDKTTSATESTVSLPDIQMLDADPAFATAAATERVADYTTALERAKATGNDILVFQRGSDWNLLGEKMYRDVWMKELLAENLGNGFILVAVDRQETLGAPSLLESATAGDSTEFQRQTKKGATPPDCQITAVQATSGSIYERRADGSWLVKLDAAKIPAQDVITATVAAKAGSQVLRLDFPTDVSMPKGCAGRATNGNFAISEVSAQLGETKLPLQAVWADHIEGGNIPRQMLDGKDSEPTNGWNAGAHTQKSRIVLVALDQPLASDAEVKVQLICRTQWAQHIPGCLRVAALPGPQLAQALMRYDAAATLTQKNATFDWQANWSVPRVALLDKDGRSIAAEDKPRATAGPAIMAKLARDMRAKRVKRDALWAEAEKATGPAKAELLRQGLDVLGLANSTGNGKRYKAIHDAIRAADPEDKSGVIRWLGFGKDPKSGVPWAKPTWSEALDTKNGTVTLTDENYREALARVDKELADPRNNILTKDYIQRIMLGKFHIYKRWKGHEEERFKVQREIAALDATTFLGIGAVGYLGQYGKSETPFLSYGWKPNQIKGGAQSWTMTDTSYYFAQPVRQKFTVAHRGGKDGMKIKRIALMDGTKALAEALPNKDCAPGADAKVVCELDCRQWKSGRNYTLVMDFETAANKTDESGNFSVEPIFEEDTASVPPGDQWWNLRQSLVQKLADAFEKGELKQQISVPVTVQELATAELLRRTADTADKIATKPGGQAMLEALTKDTEWLEAMLVTDNKDWPQVLENLYFLYHNVPGFDHPVYRKMGSAMAMQAGNMNRYRLQDRFKHMQKIHQQGLLHAKFDHLTIREMNWAVWMQGTTEDYQFMVDEMQTTWADYAGACWGIAYVDPNIYGYSVQGWGFVDPWVYYYGNGTGDRPYRVQRQVGGVCGTLSGYGAAAARSHGVMAVTVGQPGHCAYVVRVGEEWITGNDVFGPETNGASVFEGTGFPSMHRLYEAIYADQSQLIAANRLAWASHVLQDKSKAVVRVLPGLKYEQFSLPGGKLADLTKGTLTTSGSATGFDLKAATPAVAANFAVVWTGNIEVAGQGQLQISVAADDAARLIIGGTEIPTNKGWQDVKVAPGKHPIRLEYAQAGGALSLKVDWQSVTPYAVEWFNAAQETFATLPINYNVWLDSIKALESAPAVPASVWRQMAVDVAKSFSAYHEAGWALTNRCLSRIMPTMEAPDRLKVLLECHQSLKQENAPNFFGYNIGHVLNTHLGWLADPAMSVEYFKQLLKIHESSDPKKQRVFGEVLAWGQKSLGEKPATTPLFIAAMGDYFATRGAGADANRMTTMIAGGISKAAEKGDAASHKLWSGLAAKLLPSVKASDIHLTDAQVAAAPKPEPFPGSLLGDEAMLRISSASANDRPRSYDQLLNGTAPGFFETNPEEKPWAQIQLAGECELSGVSVVNRFESPADSDRFTRSFPLKVSASVDGKTWTDLATIEFPAATIRLDLQGKIPRAKFLRLEHQPVAGKPPTKLCLRNILVYGRKLY